MAKKIKTKKNKAASKNMMGPRLVIILGVLISVLFLSTTVMLCIGMVPTLVVAFVNFGKKKAKAITVGAINFAGCSPFVFELWTTGRDMANSLNIVLDANTIMIMYGAAMVGYIVEWALTGIVAGIMREKGKGKLKSIKKRQAELVDRWGKKVTGAIPLDERGFPLGEE